MPFIINDSSVDGVEAPDFNGSSPHLGDIWGHDSYPLGFDCSQPRVWPDGDLPTQWFARQESLAPRTPDALMEFQGGTFDQWGGTGYEQCAEMYNMEFERVFNKNNLAARVDIMNLYMIFGGTNWGAFDFHISFYGLIFNSLIYYFITGHISIIFIVKVSSMLRHILIITIIKILDHIPQTWSRRIFLI